MIRKITEQILVSIGKKFPATEVTKDCPFGTLHQKQCTSCKVAIPRYTKEQLHNLPKTGQIDELNNAYTCPLTVIALCLAVGKKSKKK